MEIYETKQIAIDAWPSAVASTDGNIATIPDVVEWLKQIGAKGVIPLATAISRITALQSLSTVLSDDDSTEVKDIAQDIDHIGQRWGTKHHSNPKTTGVYVSRARTALAEYESFRADPKSFKPARRRKKNKQPDSNGFNSNGLTRRFPVSSTGEEFEYAIPQSGLRMNDVLRIAHHLATFALDFDPTRPL